MIGASELQIRANSCAKASFLSDSADVKTITVFTMTLPYDHSKRLSYRHFETLSKRSPHPRLLMPAPALPVTDIYELSCLYPLVNEAVIITADGTIETNSKQRAAAMAQQSPMMVCHAKWTNSRLGYELARPFDVMELFAFVRPARFCLPTPAGLASALGLALPNGPEEEAMMIGKSAFALLDELTNKLAPQQQKLGKLAEMMGRGGWSWASIILTQIGAGAVVNAPPDPRAASIFQDLADIDDMPGRGTPGIAPIMPEAARQKLTQILGPSAEVRQSQSDYAAALSSVFASPDHETGPTLVLAEAGTGTGKTLGYLAPASLWADLNKGAVWVSTYTRSLQQQIAAELTRIYPSKTNEASSDKVVIRKGRENYLCLLNFEEALSAMAGQPQIAPALGLMARWIQASSDGDLTGTNFPAWLVDLMGPRATTSLSDRRGECIHSACSHYHKCFVEKSIRGARHADIVIANHALVMINAALSSPGHNVPAIADPHAPRRLIFDEGHHVFDAADSAFSAVLSAMEASELRRWVRGAEDGSRGRARGIRRRLEELIADQDDGLQALEDACEAARCLPAEGWRKRISEAAPLGLGEMFFFRLRRDIYQRAPDITSLFDIQMSLYPCSEEVIKAGADFATALEAMTAPLNTLSRLLLKILDEQAEELDQALRARLEGAARALERRAGGPIASWVVMLRDLSGAGRDLFVDWAQLDRRDGADIDIGLHRHFLDPTQPFAQQVLANTDGVAITSATLADTKHIASDMPDTAPQQITDWQSAKTLSGAVHLAQPALVSHHPSPFDYVKNTKIFVVNDVPRDRPSATAGAMRAFFTASQGGGLGLFTAISRLRAVHRELLPQLAEAGLPLYGQHVDQMNLATLIQLFREDKKACLLGTDAVRDGVDVPGDALRLMIYDRVPWPRPDMLFKARAAFHGKEDWTDRITRLKLRQAFGRLIRRDSDTGIFVMLDSRLPTRLTNAFPEGVEIERLSLSEALAKTKDFFAD